MQQQAPLSRRFSSRIEAPWDVYVCWGSGGYDDTSLLRDLGSRGAFVLTQKTKAVGAKTGLYFLVEEGHIRVEAVVRHLKPGRGLGLQFTAVRHEDRRHLARLMKRLRSFNALSKFRRAEYNQQAPLQ
jgi:PilZ domain-containing protein